MARSLLVLGVDPGSVCTGWGVVERSGSRLAGLEAGAIRTCANSEFHERLRDIYDGVSAVIARHRPQAVDVEDIFFARSPQAALKLGHARGVALLAAAKAELSVHAYPPALVKRAVAGKGRAPKEQVARMVAAILGWRNLPSLDATDALAVAITHLNVAPLEAARRAT